MDYGDLLARVDSMAMGMDEMCRDHQDIKRDQHIFMRNQEVLVRDMSTKFGFPLDDCTFHYTLPSLFALQDPSKGRGDGEN